MQETLLSVMEDGSIVDFFDGPTPYFRMVSKKQLNSIEDLTTICSKQKQILGHVAIREEIIDTKTWKIFVR